jgi:hypothetical protein
MHFWGERDISHNYSWAPKVGIMTELRYIRKLTLMMCRTKLQTGDCTKFYAMRYT